MLESEIIQSLYLGSQLEVNDCYILDNTYIVTTDSIAENTHFLHEWSSPEDIAIKLIEVNLSDIVVGGGNPIYCFCNLGLSKISKTSEWLKNFVQTFRSTLDNYHIKLCGGDTYSSTTTNLTLTLFGKPEKFITRDGGKIDDYLYLTGSVGLSQFGFNLLSNHKKPTNEIERIAIQRHLRPRAQFHLGKQLFAKYTIHAAMDITDGLVQDSIKMANASSIGLKIDLDKLPMLKEYETFQTIEDICSSGEELEILFLSPEKIWMDGVTEIGRATASKSKIEFYYKEKEITPKNLGFIHF